MNNCTARDKHQANLNKMKAAINADINNGIIPKTASSFAELHDYVDANEYLEIAFPEFNAEHHVHEANIYLDELDAWIKTGRPSSKPEV